MSLLTIMTSTSAFPSQS